jgi:hypothetical protein
MKASADFIVGVLLSKRCSEKLDRGDGFFLLVIKYCGTMGLLIVHTNKHTNRQTDRQSYYFLTSPHTVPSLQEMSTDNGPTTSSSVATSASASTAAMFNQPIVIDCGSATMKAGFAGGTKPKVR